MPRRALLAPRAASILSSGTEERVLRKKTKKLKKISVYNRQLARRLEETLFLTADIDAWFVRGVRKSELLFSINERLEVPLLAKKGTSRIRLKSYER